MGHKKLVEKLLIIICGLPGTGKTTLAGLLARSLKDYALVDQNKIRRRRGIKKIPPRGPGADKATCLVDQTIANFFIKNNGVIVDGGHKYRTRRHQLYGIASCFGKSALVIETICPEDLAKIRILSRPSGDELLSDPNNPSAYDKIRKSWEDVGGDYSQGHSS